MSKGESGKNKQKSGRLGQIQVRLRISSGPQWVRAATKTRPRCHWCHWSATPEATVAPDFVWGGNMVVQPVSGRPEKSINNSVRSLAGRGTLAGRHRRNKVPEELARRLAVVGWRSGHGHRMHVLALRKFKVLTVWASHYRSSGGSSGAALAAALAAALGQLWAACSRFGGEPS